jgi:hypothetical protein
MYATLRIYRLNPIFEKDFTKLWNQLVTELKNDGLVDQAILHKESKISYISYLQWKSKSYFETLLKPADEKYKVLVKKLHECCNSVAMLHRMEVLDELDFKK